MHSWGYIMLACLWCSLPRNKNYTL